MSNFKYTKKQDYIGIIKNTVRNAGFPEIPSECLDSMNTVALVKFYDRWIIKICSKSDKCSDCEHDKHKFSCLDDTYNGYSCKCSKRD